MKLSIKSTFTFLRVNRQIKSLIQNTNQDLRQDSAQGLKANIDKGDGFEQLQDSTLAVRKFQGISGSKPLFATGSLYDSIKSNEDGVEMNKYGVYQHRGYTPKKIPLIKDKTLFYIKNRKGIKVPARAFIKPSKEVLQKVADKFFGRFLKLFKKKAR